MQGRSRLVVDVVDPGAGDPQLLQFVVAAPPRGGSRLGYARAVLPAPHLSPRTTTSAHSASARARPGSAGDTPRAALASERPPAQRRGSHLQFLRLAFWRWLKALKKHHTRGSNQQAASSARARGVAVADDYPLNPLWPSGYKP